MLDAINFEKQGIPAVAVVTEPFVRTGEAVAEMHGLPSYPFVVVAHPFGSLIQPTVRARADGALALIELLLLGDGEGRSSGAGARISR